MKIIFIVTGLSTGGAELMLLKLLRHLDRSHFKVTVISLRDKGDVGQRIEALGIPVVAMDFHPMIINPIKIISLFNILRNIQPDIVQTWMYHADLLGGLTARIAGCNHVVWGVRNSNLNAEFTNRSTLMVVKACAKLSFWLPRWILSCSTRAMSVHAGVGYCEKKIKVIPNGFELNRFKPNHEARMSVRQELALEVDTPLVGMMARFDAQKNHSGFMDAAVLIRQKIPGVHFILAGSDIDARNELLNHEIQIRGLNECVHLLGLRDDMPRLMASLDVLASPSSFGEAFPNVLGEAMSCGVPCVVTDVGDSAEIVGELGRVVQPGNMMGLATHIVEFLRLPAEKKLTLGIQVRERVELLYDINHVARLYMNFYDGMC